MVGLEGLQHEKQQLMSFLTASEEIASEPRWAVHEIGHAFENRILQIVQDKPARGAIPTKLLVRTPTLVVFMVLFMDWQYNENLHLGNLCRHVRGLGL
jgi:hypothetical protein